MSEDQDWPIRPQNERMSSLAAAKLVVPREEFHESFLLCRLTGDRAINGLCKIHMTDACLSRYVRYNHVFETMERNFKDAMARTRKQVS